MSFCRSVSPRIAINERIKQEEKDKIKIVNEERRNAKKNLKKLGNFKCKWVDDANCENGEVE